MIIIIIMTIIKIIMIIIKKHKAFLTILLVSG